MVGCMYQVLSIWVIPDTSTPKLFGSVHGGPVLARATVVCKGAPAWVWSRRLCKLVCQVGHTRRWRLWWAGAVVHAMCQAHALLMVA